MVQRGSSLRISTFRKLRGNREVELRWNELHARKVQVLEKQCQQFSALSNGLIKADIAGSLNLQTLKQQFKVAFASLNIKDSKIDELCQRVLSAADPMIAWNDILADLQKLVLHKDNWDGPPPTDTGAGRVWSRRH